MVELRVVCNICGAMLTSCFYSNVLNVDRCYRCDLKSADSSYDYGFEDGHQAALEEAGLKRLEDNDDEIKSKLLLP